MKKSALVALVALVAGVALLAGCSKSSNSSSATTATVPSSSAVSSTTGVSAPPVTTTDHGWVTTYCSTLRTWATAASGTSGPAPTDLTGWSAWAGQTANFANSVLSATNSAIATLQGAGTPSVSDGAAIAQAGIASFQAELAAQTKVVQIVQGTAPTSTAQMTSLVQQITTANQQAGLSFAQDLLQVKNRFPGDFASLPACAQVMQQLHAQG